VYAYDTGPILARSTTRRAYSRHTSEKTALRYQRAELDYQRAIMEAQSQEIQEQVFGESGTGR
jgi:hypothetical protein